MSRQFRGTPVVTLFLCGQKPQNITDTGTLRDTFLAFLRANARLLPRLTQVCGLDVHGVADEFANLFGKLGYVNGTLGSGTPILQRLFPDHFRFLLSWVGSPKGKTMDACLAEFQQPVDSGDVAFAIITVCDRSDIDGWASKASICSLLEQCLLTVLSELFADGNFKMSFRFADDGYDHACGIAEQFGTNFRIPKGQQLGKRGTPQCSMVAKNGNNTVIFVHLPDIGDKIDETTGLKQISELCGQLTCSSSDTMSDIVMSFVKSLVPEPTAASQPLPEPTSATSLHVELTDAEIEFI